jgi:hypothetical protein
MMAERCADFIVAAQHQTASDSRAAGPAGPEVMKQ